MLHWCVCVCVCQVKHSKTVPTDCYAVKVQKHLRFVKAVLEAVAVAKHAGNLLECSQPSYSSMSMCIPVGEPAEAADCSHRAAARLDQEQACARTICRTCPAGCVSQVPPSHSC